MRRGRCYPGNPFKSADVRTHSAKISAAPAKAPVTPASVPRDHWPARVTTRHPRSRIDNHPPMIYGSYVKIMESISRTLDGRGPTSSARRVGSGLDSAPIRARAGILRDCEIMKVTL